MREPATSIGGPWPEPGYLDEVLDAMFHGPPLRAEDPTADEEPRPADEPLVGETEVPR